MEAGLLHRHDRPAPRYTSYPTAPHFTPEIDAACYRERLEALDPAVPLYRCRSISIFRFAIRSVGFAGATPPSCGAINP